MPVDCRHSVSDIFKIEMQCQVASFPSYESKKQVCDFGWLFQDKDPKSEQMGPWSSSKVRCLSICMLYWDLCFLTTLQLFS
jgi:hypothetical protein